MYKIKLKVFFNSTIKQRHKEKMKKKGLKVMLNK